MIFSGINFGLHFLALNRRNSLLYFRDTEVRAYVIDACCSQLR